MADDERRVHRQPVRELEEIDPALLPQVDELRAEQTRAQRARNRRRNWIIAAVLVVVTGAVAVFLPRVAEQAEGGHHRAQAAGGTDRRPSRPSSKRAKN